MKDNNMKKYKCDNKIIRTSKIFITLIFLILLLISEYFFLEYPFIMLACLAVLIGITSFLWFYYCEKFFAAYEVIISDDTIMRKSGFFFYTENIMPLDAVQYSSSIISRFFNKIGVKGLNIVMIYAYGGMMSVPFLSENDTEELKEFLDEYINSKKTDSGEKNV